MSFSFNFPSAGQQQQQPQQQQQQPFTLGTGFGGQTTTAAAPVSSNTQQQQSSPFSFNLSTSGQQQQQPAQQQQQQPASTSTFGGFGTGAFGQQQQQQPATTTAPFGGFGQQQQQTQAPATTATSSFGTGTGFFGTAPAATTATAAPAAGGDAASLNTWIQFLFQSNKTGIVFKHTFKNVAKAPEGQPQPEQPTLVPVEVCGFDKLEERIKQQKDQIQAYNDLMDKIEARINKHQRDLETIKHRDVERIKQRHMELSARLLKMQSKLEVLMAQGTMTLTSDDIVLRERFKAQQHELHKPSQFRGQLNELIPQLKKYLHHGGQIIASQQSGALLDEDNTQRIREFLEQQNNGLQQLMTILKEDLKDSQFVLAQLRDARDQFGQRERSI